MSAIVDTNLTAPGIDKLNNNATGPRSALQLAITSGSIGAVRRIVEALSAQGRLKEALERPENGMTAFGLAVATGDTRVLQVVMEARGASGAVASKNDVAALYNAAACGHTAFVAQLIAGGVDVTTPLAASAHPLATRCPLPLHAAVWQGHVEVVRELLRARNVAVQLKMRNDSGLTPLHLALLANGNEETYDAIFELLVGAAEAVATVDITAARNNTPLMLAARAGRVRLARMLIDKGASLNCTNAMDENALIAAASGGSVEIVQTILDRLRASKPGLSDIDHENADGMTAIGIAATQGSAAIVGLLINNGASANHSNRKRHNATPLHYAVSKGHLDVVKILVERGKADVNAVKGRSDGGGRTPVDIANAKSLADIKAYLISKGATAPKAALTAAKVQFSMNAAMPSAVSTVATTARRVRKPQPVAVTATPVTRRSAGGGSVNGSERPWRTVRVFLSSTFVDMHSERDYVVKHVMPALRKKCEQRRVRIVDIDLRWGVTRAEAENGQVIEVCLSEAARCELFVGMLGDRYGWVPDKASVSDSVRTGYGWDDGASMTHMEIAHAVLRRAKRGGFGVDTALPKYALFMLRDAAKMPPATAALFAEKDPESQKKLAALKADIRKLPTQCPGRVDVVDYTLTALQTPTGRDELPALSGLDQCYDVMVESLWKAIDKMFPETNSAVENVVDDPLAAERAYHEAFLHSRSHGFVGRGEILDRIRTLVDDNGGGRPIAVIGQPGSGKSALLAHFAVQYARDHSDVFVLSHFVGASPRSVDIRHTLWRLCIELARKYEISAADIAEAASGSDQPNVDIIDILPRDYEGLVRVLPQILQRASGWARVLIVIDALNQLDGRIHRAHKLEWLPWQLPRGIAMVVSCTEEGSGRDMAVAMETRGCATVRVGELTQSDRAEVVTRRLADYGKRLDSGQMSVLLSKPGASRPLWLVAAVEELRMFGRFDQLEAQLHGLANDVPGLFEQVLARWEREHGEDFVKLCLGLLDAARGGLAESELIELLEKEVSTVGQGVRAHWSRFYIAGCGEMLRRGDNGGRLDFFHRQLAKAVRRRYIEKSPQVEAKLHAKLARYFLEKVDNGSHDEHAVGDVCYHAAMAGIWQDLSQKLLGNIQFVETKASLRQTYDLAADYVFARELAANSAAAAIERLDVFGEFVSRNIHVLDKTPELIYQQAANHYDVDSPLRRMIGDDVLWAHATANGRRPFVQWANRPAGSSADSGGIVMTLVGHTGFVGAVAVSKEGKSVVTGCAGGLVAQWNLSTGEQLATTGLPAGVNALAFVGTMRVLAGLSNGRVVMLDTKTGLLPVMEMSGHTEEVRAVAMATSGPAAGMAVSASADGTVRFWNVANGRMEHTITVGSPVYAVAIATDGQALDVGCKDKNIYCYAVSATGGSLKSTKTATLSGHTKPVMALRKAPTNELFSASQDRNVRSWNTATKHAIHSWSHKDCVAAVDISPDGKWMATASYDKTTKIIDLTNNTTVCELQAHTHWVLAVHFTPDGRHVITGSADKSVKVHRLPSTSGNATRTALSGAKATTTGPGALLASDRSMHHTKITRGCKFSYDGQWLLTASWDQTVKLWSATSGECRKTFQASAKRVNAADWAPGRSDLFITGASDRTVRIWNVSMERGMECHEVSALTGHSMDVFWCCYSKDGRFIASASQDQTVMLWDAATADGVATLRGHTNWVNTVAFSPDSNLLVTASHDRTVRLWDVRSCQEITEMKGQDNTIYHAAFSPDGSLIATCSEDRTVRLWDPFGMSSWGVLRGHEGQVTAAVWTPSGDYLWSAGGDNTLKLFDVESGNCAWTFHASGQMVGVDMLPARISGQKTDLLAATDAAGTMYLLRLHGMEGFGL